ncbi:MAG: ethylbenzene dehydrogenase-related protein [Candidatus Methylomirabilales bacterium]
MARKALQGTVVAITALTITALAAGPGDGRGPEATPRGKTVQRASGTLTTGKALYEEKCAVCHGREGKGNGPAAYLLYPKPRDFTRGRFKIRSTMNLPTDQDLLRTITKGIPGTSMPSWASLTEQERGALVAYVKSLSPVFTTQPAGQLVAIPRPPKRTPRLLALGKKFYKEGGCFDCHGISGRGDGPSAATLKDEWGYRIVPYDFTIPGKMKAGSTVQDIYRTLQVGIGGTPMPSYGDSLTEEETWALAYYTLSLAQRTPRKEASTESGMIRSRFLPGNVPLDPMASMWTKVPATQVSLRTLWTRAKTIDRVAVKSLHNGTQIAILLEWDDAIADQEVLGHQDFRDAVAVQFPVQAPARRGAGHGEPSFTMGDKKDPVNIWHWKADWEADLQRYRDIQDRYAGMAVDEYPFNQGVPLGSPSAAQVRVPTSRHDPTYLAGWGAGSLLSSPNRRSSVEDLNAIGFGTLTSQPPQDQNVQGRGVWTEGKWRVVMVRNIHSGSKRDAQFSPGQSLPVAFAVWDGTEGDRDGQKAVSTWQRLQIEEVR